MAIRSREFVGIAEGIKSHELSTKSKIESLKGTVSDLSSRRFGLNREISSLEAELAAAYEDTDEDDEPNYALIDAIESQIASAENELSEVENELDDANSELSQSEMELAAVMEEKAQTLFEIQERARKTSQNIATVGGMYGAYMGVGNTLQNSMQTSLASLSQAASILDGSVDGSSSGGAGGGQGRTASGGGLSAPSDLSTSALSAFSGGGSDSSFSGGSSPSHFSTNHNSGATPASTHNFGGSKSINPQKTINFNSGQSEGSAASSAFTCMDEEDDAAVAANYTSDQKSSGQDTNFAQTRSDLKQRRSWSQQYQVGYTPSASLKNDKPKDGEIYRGEKERQLGHEKGFEYDDAAISTFLSSILKKKESAVSDSNGVMDAINADKERFLNDLKVKVEPVADYDRVSKRKSTSSGDPSIGPKQRELVHETYMEHGAESLNLVAAVTSFFKRNEKEGINCADITSHGTTIKNQIVLSAENPIAQKYNWGFKDRTYTLQEDLKAVNPNFYNSRGERTYDDRWTRNCQRCIVAFELRCRGVDVQAKERVLDGTDTLPMMDHPNGWLSVFKNATPINCGSDTGLSTGARVREKMANWGDGARAIVRIQRCDTIRLKDSSGNFQTYAVETVNGRTVVCDVVTRKEVDISNTYPNMDLSSGIEVMISANPYNPNSYDRVLCSKKTGAVIGHLQSHGGHVFTAIQHKGETVFCDAQTGKIISDPSNYFLCVKREETYVVRVDNVTITDRAFDCCKSIDKSSNSTNNGNVRRDDNYDVPYGYNNGRAPPNNYK